jgi:hypothetical protein
MSDDEDERTTVIATTAAAPPSVPPPHILPPVRPPSSSSSEEGFSSSSDDEDEEPASQQPAAYTGRQCGVNAWTDCTVPPPATPRQIDYGRRFRVIDYDEIARQEDAALQTLLDDLCSAERSTRAFRRNEHDAAATAASFLCSARGCDVLQPFFHESLFVNPRGPVAEYARIVQLMVRLLERRALGAKRGQWYAQPERAHMLAVCHQLSEVAAIIRAWGHTDRAAPANGYVDQSSSLLPAYLTQACGQAFAEPGQLSYNDDVTWAQRFAATLLSIVYAGQVRTDAPPRRPVVHQQHVVQQPQHVVRPRTDSPPQYVLSTVAIAQLDALVVPT